MGWKCHFSIIPLAEYNFEHNSLALRVTPESITLSISNIIPQTLILGKTKSQKEEKQSGQAKKKKKKKKEKRYSRVP